MSPLFVSFASPLFSPLTLGSAHGCREGLELSLGVQPGALISHRAALPRGLSFCLTPGGERGHRASYSPTWSVRSESANEWIKKLWCIYTLEFYAAERKELLPFVSAWMKLESITLSEISQAVRDKYHMILPLTGT